MGLSLKDLRRLKTRKGRQQLGALLLEGERLVAELEETRFTDCELLVTAERSETPSRFPRRVLTARQLAAISDVETPQGVAAVVPLAELGRIPDPPGALTLYFEEIRDPGNLGTALRAADWFGGCRVWLSPGSVDPFNPKVARASMGAILRVPVREGVDPGEALAAHGAPVALDAGGESLPHPALAAADCLIFGGEARGLGERLRRRPDLPRLAIPGRGGAESLNLAVSAAICLYERTRRG